jgi:hypothetical protein
VMLYKSTNLHSLLVRTNSYFVQLVHVIEFQFKHQKKCCTSQPTFSMIGNFILGKLLSVIIVFVIELKWELPKGMCLRSESDVNSAGELEF